MAIWREYEGATVAPSSLRTLVTIGNFDGVHRGHQAVLALCRERDAGLPVVAVTFDPHPLAVVAGGGRGPRRLTTLERRISLLRIHGAEEVRVLAFTTEMAAWSPDEFVARVIVEQLHAGLVVVGENFRFGHRAAGDLALLTASGALHGFDVEGLAMVGGGYLSSTRVRDLVAAGDLVAAAEVLGRPHEISGEVVRGDQRGRELGFPTANVPVDESYAVPPDGVYAGWVVRAHGERLPAAISVGTNPTFDGVERRVESYVLDRTDLHLYGETIRVELVERLRGMVRYDGTDVLIAQMRDDVERARRILA